MAQPYIIAELAEGEKGGFKPRGAAKHLWQCKDHEVCISGPADTGKSFAACHKLDALMWRYPGAQAAIVRKVASSMASSVLQTYHKVLGPNSPVQIYGGNTPRWYDYPNGSRVFVGGMDDPGKVLSSERDVIYINQAEELTLDDYETLTTRCNGRAGNMPYAQLILDCNPGPPTHWIKHRPSISFFESRHEDNPTIYDDEGRLTESGAQRIKALDELTGVRLLRLRYGRWVAAEGVIYESWDPKVHLADHRDIPADWPRWWTVDFGFVNPFVWQAWAEGPDGELWMYREIYRTKRLVEDHAKDILAACGWELQDGRPVPTRDNHDPLPRAIYCDHDAEDRATLQKHLGLITTPAHKTVADGIQAVQSRLRVQPNGRPRIHLLRDALIEQDLELVNNRKPCCTAEEFEVYVWDTRQGLRKGDQPVKENDHGMDGLRYMVAARDLKPSLVITSPSVETVSLERGAIPTPGALPQSSTAPPGWDNEGRVVPVRVDRDSRWRRRRY